MPTFRKGQIVESLINTQGLRLGFRYRVIEVRTDWAPMGGFTVYRVVADPAFDRPIDVVNGHLVLKSVSFVGTCDGCGETLTPDRADEVLCARCKGDGGGSDEHYEGGEDEGLATKI